MSFSRPYAPPIPQSDVTSLVTDLAARQPIDGTLTALAGVTTAADKLIYATGVDSFATTDITALGRSLIDDATASTARATLGLVIGTDVLSPSGNGSGLTALNATQLTTGTIPADRIVSGWTARQFLRLNAAGSALESADPDIRSVLTADAAHASTGSNTTFTRDVCTLTLPETGLYRVRGIMNCRNPSASSLGIRIVSGTAVTTATNGDTMGIAIQGNNNIIRVLYVSGTPQVYGVSAAQVQTFASCAFDIIIDCTTAGTLIMQMASSTSTFTETRGTHLSAQRFAA